MDRWLLKSKKTTKLKEDETAVSKSPSNDNTLTSIPDPDCHIKPGDDTENEKKEVKERPSSEKEHEINNSSTVATHNHNDVSSVTLMEEDIPEPDCHIEPEDDIFDTDEERKRVKDRPSFKKVIKKTHSKRFKPDWLKLPEFKNWLLQGKEFSEAVCRVCNVVIKAGKSDLQKHASGKNHLKNMELEEKSTEIQPVISNFVSHNNKVKNTEAAICTFLVENNLPINTVEPLLEFIKSLPDKSVMNKIQLAKQKATNIIRNGLRPFFQESLLDKMKGSFYSLYIDETTDVSVKKQLAVMVSYCNNFETVVDFIALIDCPEGTAISIYNELLKCLDENKMPLQNWVGFCSDTTSTMMGLHNSVSQLIKKNHPQVQVIKCTCHLVHLVASYACGKLSNSLEDLCRTIFNHFSRSPKNSAAYKEFQTFFDVKPHKMRPCQTRWLSLQACVGRILEQWEALENYWRVLSVEDPTHANTHTHKSLQNLLLKCQM